MPDNQLIVGISPGQSQSLPVLQTIFDTSLGQSWSAMGQGLSQGSPSSLTRPSLAPVGGERDQRLQTRVVEGLPLLGSLTTVPGSSGGIAACEGSEASGGGGSFC